MVVQSPTVFMLQRLRVKGWPPPRVFMVSHERQTDVLLGHGFSTGMWYPNRTPKQLRLMDVDSPVWQQALTHPYLASSLGDAFISGFVGMVFTQSAPPMIHISQLFGGGVSTHSIGF